ncbi:MAG: MurR/RpiR family transcriptional regulator [Sphaerochaetaceae bacterium]|nr:MurR/RpiR family transcriptional regulator [Sphaerochaetaceae bacterium]MDC7248490.1 MurR/RpiR family transcriptional regulator [Sphaerochaetaceae bacterium]
MVAKGKSVLKKIESEHSKLTKIQKKIADYILLNLEEVPHLSISQLTKNSGCSSESAVVRFYQALDFKSYHDFILTLTSEIAKQSIFQTYSEIIPNDDPLLIKNKVIQGAILAFEDDLANMKNDEAILEAVEVLSSAKRIFFFGYGESGYLCQSMKFKFVRLGFDCFYTTDSHMSPFYFSKFEKGDVVVAISDSGKSKDVIIALRASQAIAKRIAITGTQDNEVSQLADISLVTGVEESRYRTDGIFSRFLQKSIIDILFLAVAAKLGDSALSNLELSKKSLRYLKS